MKLQLFLVTSLLFVRFDVWGAVDFHTQSRIKGAVMGALLGDAFARVATSRSGMVDLTENICSFKDFREEDWIYDAGHFRIGTGTENTHILVNQLESLIEGRRFKYTREKLINLCTYSYKNLLQQLLEPHFEHYRFSSTMLQKTKNRGNRRVTRFSKPDASALIRVIPVGLVFLDDIQVVQEIADLEIQITDSHPTTRIAGIALAVGIASAARNMSVDGIVDHMIKVSEYYETKFGLNSFDRSPSKYMRLARQEAKNGAKAKKLLGTKIGTAMITGKWAGYDPVEALGVAVYCFVRHGGSLKGVLVDTVHAEGNSELHATIGGALAGAKTGFWALKQEGYESEFEMLERINVIQGMCNDAYVALSDFPYSAHS